MAFLEARLDAKVTRSVQFIETVPGRDLIRYQSGKLKQNFTAALPITRCELIHGLRSSADYQIVLDAWYIVMFTPYEGLRVKNWRDYIATRTNTSLTLISGSIYQLNRKHTFGGINFIRPIYKPVASTVVVYDAGGTPLTASIDYTNGQATVTGTPASWSGEFDLPMTFTDNEWSASLEVSTNNLHVFSGSIAMEEIRL